MADANALGRSNPGQGVRLVARQARRQCPRRALADGHERSPAVNHGSTVSVTEERRLDRPLLRVGGALGAHLGHGPPDNRGHERSVPDTWVLPFTSANVRCQRAPLAWFFPDTEAVMELRLVVTIDTASGQEEWEVKLCKLR
jgi:hypothetical protein